eukprot:ANDGO_03226.mRNA.1 hypothetical protein
MKRLVIVGGGYATMCLLDVLSTATLVAGGEPYQLTVYQTEEFVNRPAIFFKLKFPEKDAPYGLKDASYFEKIRALKIERRVSHVVRGDKQLILDPLDVSRLLCVMDKREDGSETHQERLVGSENECETKGTTNDGSAKGQKDEQGLMRDMSTVSSLDVLDQDCVGYDLLVLATGGIPSVLHPRVIVEPLCLENSDHASFILEHVDLSPLVFDLAVHPSVSAPIMNAICVRNRAEVESLASILNSESPSTLISENRPVVIVGGGVLALDLVSSMLEGRKDTKIIMIVRRGAIGASLVDEEGQDILKQEALGFRKGAVKIMWNEEIEMLFASPLETADFHFSGDSATEASVDGSAESSSRRVQHRYWASRLRTKQGTEIPCGCLIYALGVTPNTGLAKKAGLPIGPNGGILASMASAQSPADSSIFVCGDCAEVYDPLSSFAQQAPKTTVWRNWTMARETALFCARSLAPVLGVELKKAAAATEEAEFLCFAQNLKLFNQYIYCVGSYLEKPRHWFDVGKLSIVRQRVVVHLSRSQDRHLRLTLVHVELEDGTEAWILIGALVMGTAVSDHRLGMNLHKSIKLARRLRVPADGNWASYDWDAWVKENRKSPADSLVLSWLTSISTCT